MGGVMDNSVIVIVVIGIVICIVAMCREITCWYFKFNEMLIRDDRNSQFTERDLAVP
jgi:uncharacterized membrane protein